MGLEKINIFRRQKGITIEQLSESSGVPLSTIKKICAGITTNPNLDTVKAIAKALNCKLDDFDDIEKSSTPAKAEAEDLSKDEQKLLEEYRQLNPDGQQVALDFMDSLTYNPKYKKCDQCKNMDADA